MTTNWNRRSYTKDQFIESWSTSISIAEVARRLGLSIYGSTYTTLRATAEECGLNEDHMLGQAANSGSRHKGGAKPAPIEDVLIEGSHISSSFLKEKLIKSGLLKEECYALYCPLSNPTIDGFTGELVPLKLALDHINGNNTDNRLENLRLLCYHCHGQTTTYCRRKVKTKEKLGSVAQLADAPDSRSGSKDENLDAGSNPVTPTLCVICLYPCASWLYWHRQCLSCIDCGKSTTSLRCKSCASLNMNKNPTKIDWPDLDELIRMVQDSSFLQVGKKLGVSDNAVRKHIHNQKKRVSVRGF